MTESITHESLLPVLANGNRHQRRAQQNLAGDRSVVSQIRHAHQIFHQRAFEVDNQVTNNPKQVLAEIIYQGTSLWMPFIGAARTLHQVLDKVQKEQEHKLDTQNVVASCDLFSRPVKNLTLREIEQMPLPLEVKNIERINGMIRLNWRRWNLTEKDQSVTANLFHLTTQNLAQPDRFTLPSNLSSLQQRFRAYLDYYAPFFTEPNLVDVPGFLGLAWSLGKTGPYLLEALGCYIPARLGILPSSAAKLYMDPAEYGNVGTHLFDKYIRQKMLLQTSKAYRPKSLPSHLSSYQHYDSEIDKKAASLLTNYYNRKISDQSEQGWAKTSARESLGRLVKFRKDLRTDILGSPNQSLTIPLVSHPLFAEAFLTCHPDKKDAPFKKTLILVVKFKNQETYLTLEAAGEDNLRLYGIPPMLKREIPHVEDFLAEDILLPVLSIAKSRYPGVEFLPQIFVNTTWKESPPIKLPIKEVQPPKKKRLRLPVFLTKPLLPETVVVPEQRFTVHFSRDELIKKVGKKTPEDRINQMMADIRRFELGLKQPDPWMEKNRVKIRSGDYRLILLSKGGEEFLLDDAGDRKDVYRKEERKYRS